MVAVADTATGRVEEWSRDVDCWVRDVSPPAIGVSKSALVKRQLTLLHSGGTVDLTRVCSYPSLPQWHHGYHAHLRPKWCSLFLIPVCAHLHATPTSFLFWFSRLLDRGAFAPEPVSCPPSHPVCYPLVGPPTIMWDEGTAAGDTDAGTS